MFTATGPEVVEKINIVEDERVQRREAVLNGKTYGREYGLWVEDEG